MPKFLENKLKAEYGQDSATPYKVMNALGVMRGNVETPKGVAMEAKHAAGLDAARASHPYAPRLGKFLHPKKFSR
jgi:hypothetical protein